MKTLVALVFLGLLLGAFAHKHKHHDKDDKEKDGKHHDKEHDKDDKEHEKDDKEHQLRVCHYKATDGSSYDLRLMNKSSRAYSFVDPSSHSVIYFRPCRSVEREGCDPHAAVCVVENNGKAINFGTAQKIQWADGVETGASIEATYGNGELCSNGAPRKTVVEYRCSLDAQKPAPGMVSASTVLSLESRIVSVESHPCFLKMVVESPHACPTVEYCHSISLENACVSATQGLCSWSVTGHCVAEGEDCGRFRHASPVQIMAIMTLLTLFISLCVGLCCCACAAASKSRRRNRRAQLKEDMETQEMELISEQEQQAPEQGSEQQPSAPQYQPIPIFYPGQQIPMSPYSLQGYPVMQFVVPPQSKKGESA